MRLYLNLASFFILLYMLDVCSHYCVPLFIPAMVLSGMCCCAVCTDSFLDAGGGSSYNWMTPSLQSLDPSFTMGTGGGTQSTSASESALLFSKMMRPPKRPLRAIRPGEGFGTERLKPDETASLG